MKARKTMDRRDFLKTGGVLLVGSPFAYALRVLPVPDLAASNEDNPLAGRRWGMVIDLNRCSADCDACTVACREENNVAFYGDARWDIHWIRKVTIESKDPTSETVQSLPLLCNHCEDPPCALVCPVQATYKREDGIVIVDHHRCIGCRYCMVACPYNARFFNYRENEEWPNKKLPRRSHGVAESCNFCAHRVDDGGIPACVEACQKKTGALSFGDMNDPESDVSRLIAEHPVKGLREDLGTEPKVLYIGLSER
jgi:molybdopterin-containing oxidoreductase family iron-sulfur binding subunit